MSESNTKVETRGLTLQLAELARTLASFRATLVALAAEQRQNIKALDHAANLDEAMRRLDLALAQNAIALLVEVHRTEGTP
jgi:hypothetical protein